MTGPSNFRVDPSLDLGRRAREQPGQGAAVGPAEGWDAHVHVFDGRPVPAAHYQPGPYPLARLQAGAAAAGVGRFLLVQPSVYGRDNSLLLGVLRSAPGRHRAVVVLQGDEPDAVLDGMADAGVRGVRINAVSPQGSDESVLGLLAPRLRARGWFVQWYVPSVQLARVAALSAQLGLVAVLDHLAGLTAAAWADASGRDTAGIGAALSQLADQGAWLKLSGWYRLSAAPPYDSLLPMIAALHRRFDGRCVWGSDWPHTRFMEPGAAGAVPTYSSLLSPLHAALGGDAAAAVLHTSPTALLG